MSNLSENVVAFAALMLAAPAVPIVHAQTAGDAPDKASVAELKRDYLACNRGALDARQGADSIMQCSVVYEKLLRRGFGGDFYKLLAWSKAHTSNSVGGVNSGTK